MNESPSPGEPRDLTVAAAFAHLVDHGDRNALICDGETVTYQELDARGNQVANALVALGVGAGQVAAFALPTGPDIVAWYIGCARAGVVAAPLPTRLTAEELADNVIDCGAVVLVYSRDREEAVERLGPRSADLSHVLRVDDARLVAAPTTPVDVAVAPDDLFCIMYTGGSTGAPKAAMQTHRNWAACIDSVAQEWSLRADDRHLLVLPMSHVSWFTVAAHLYAGATTTLMSQWDPSVAIELIASERMTVLNMIPTMLGDLTQAAAGFAHDVSSVRQLTVAGSPMPVEMYERATAQFGNVIGGIYGLTETSGPISFLHPRDMHADKLRSGGRPGAYVEISIRADEGRALGPGEHGEIALRGAQVTPGYLGRPAETAEAIVDGWFRTGDVGCLDADGFVFIVDRKKDMIKSGGYNVYPKEVEDVLYAHPDVIEAAVIGVPDPRWMEAVHAVVVLRTGASDDTTPEVLIHFAREHLAGYKAPKTLCVVDRLPRTGVNKFDKRALRRAHASDAR